MKILIVMLFVSSFSVVIAETIPQSSLTYYQFSPCSRWEMTVIDGRILNTCATRGSVVSVPEVFSLVDILKTYSKKVEDLENRITELEAKLEEVEE